MNSYHAVPGNFIFRLETPPHICVKVFSSLHPWLRGYPKLDDAIQCVDPWTTAMKYMDHMTQRGWESVRVDHFKGKNKETIVIVLEAPIGKH